METKTKRKEINNRKNQHYKETLYRDQRKNGHTSKPADLFDPEEREDPRELIYKEFAREQRTKRIINAITMAIVFTGTVYLIFTFGVKS